MDTAFPQIGGKSAGIGGENSFWPSFTDVMMVITMIFLMATSVLVVRNWHLVAELRESIEAERLAAQVIESTSQENATLEERLANAEQANSILRLRLMKRGEELEQAQQELRQKQAAIGALERDTGQLRLALDYADARLDEALREIADASTRIEALTQSTTGLEQQLAQLRLEQSQTQGSLTATREQLLELSDLSTQQRQSIRELTAERESLTQESTRLTQERDALSQQNLLLAEEVQAYNQQLLTLKGDYETVKSKYEELVRPARSALGKYIAEVYYVKGQAGNVIRFRTPGDQSYSDMTLAEVEQRLEQIKAEQGKNLYIKIIIPEDSGLSYNEAWEFMRSLLVKYDYYYQE